MPWCPICKSEYREGITNCYDCKVPLVDSLDDFNESADSEENPAEIDAARDGKTYDGADDGTALSDDSEGYGSEDFENDVTEEDSSPSNTFVKKSDQYQEYLFSAYTCMIVGFAGIVFGILNIAGVFSVVSAAFSQYILLGVFIIFFIGGIAMYVKSKSIKAQVGDEDKMIESVNNWLSENISVLTLDSMKDPGVSDEVNYLNYCERVREMLLSEMPETDRTMADSLIDEYISGIIG